MFLVYLFYRRPLQRRGENEERYNVPVVRLAVRQRGGVFAHPQSSAASQRTHDVAP